jgi:sulfide:quinone oxidoreductase
MKKRIVILGAGIGGVATAMELSKTLGDQHEIVLVDKEEHYRFAPSYLWLIVGKRELDQLSIPIKGIERRGIRFVQGAVEHIDPQNRLVRVAGQDISADYLVIALGAETHMDGLSGVASHGHNLYSGEGAQMISNTRADARGKRLAIVVCSMPFKCPAAPYEAAMLLQSDLGGARSGTTVSIYTPEPGPLPVAGEAVSGQVADMLVRKGLKYFPKHAVTDESSAGRLVFQDGASAEYDYLVYVPKHRAPQVLVDCGLAQPGGWAPVDRHTLATRFAHVYVMGDAAGITLKNGKALPKAGMFASGQAKVVAQNIIASLNGAQQSARFEGHGACFIEMGKGLASKGSGNFYAEPNPEVAMAFPTPFHHWAKVVLEKYWLNFVY